MSLNPVKPLTWGYINIGHTPQLTLLCCEHRTLQPRQWHSNVLVRVPYWRLYWNDRPGACLLAADGRRHTLDPDHFILVAPNTSLSKEQPQPVEHYYTHFTAGLPFARVQNRVHRFSAHPCLLEAMLRDYPRHGKAAASRQARRAATALNLSWHALATLPEAWLPPEDCHPQRLQELLQWWESQDWRPVSNRELAERVRMHPGAFCRYFRQAVGTPPQTYGQIRRIDRACLLLHFSPLSIKQIAEAVGFCDRYYFSYKFRKLRGISPAAFRRQFLHATGPAQP